MRPHPEGMARLAFRITVTATLVAAGCGGGSAYHVARPDSDSSERVRYDSTGDAEESGDKEEARDRSARYDFADDSVDGDLVRPEGEMVDSKRYATAPKPMEPAPEPAPAPSFGPKKKPRSITRATVAGSGGMEIEELSMGSADSDDYDEPMAMPTMEKRSAKISLGRIFKTGGGGKGKKKKMKMGKSMAAPSAMEGPGSPAPVASADRGATARDEAPPADGIELPPARVRKEFPEALLFAPRIITGADGTATLPVPLADTVTDWRVTALASTADGRFGDAESAISVFQPFFINVRTPRTLFQGDVVTLQVGVFNYLDEEQTVKVTVRKEGWFDSESPLSGTLVIPAGSARALPITIRAVRNGRWALHVDANSGGHADAVETPVVVDPGGVEVSSGGVHLVAGTRTYAVPRPADALPTTASVMLRVYGGAAATLEEDLRRFVELPNGCLEQTISRMDANLAAVHYLEASGRGSDALAVEARRNLRAGYLKLLTHREGGAFNLYPTGDRASGIDDYEGWLAIRALELLEQVAKLKGVTIDPELITELANWTRSRYLTPLTAPYVTVYTDDGVSVSGLIDTHPALAAATARALAVELPLGARRRFEMLLPAMRPHAAAMLLSYARRAGDADLFAKAAARLETLALHSDDGTYWEAGERTLSAAYGTDADLETTAIAATELLLGGEGASRDLGGTSVSWLLSRREAAGGWSTTSATARAVEAVGAMSRAEAESATKGRVMASVAGAPMGSLTVPKSGSIASLDLTGRVKPGSSLEIRTTSPARVELVVRYRTPYESWVRTTPPTYSMEVAYRDVEVKTGEVIPVTVRAKRTGGHGGVNPAVLRIPIASTFEVDERGLERLVTIEAIDRFERDARGLTFYVDDVDSYGRELTFYVRALHAGEASTGIAEVYEYYHPKARGLSKEARVRTYSDRPK